MPDDQQCPQTEWLADLKNLISSAEDKAGGGKKGGKKKRSVSKKCTNQCPFIFSSSSTCQRLFLSVTSNSSNHIYKTKEELIFWPFLTFVCKDTLNLHAISDAVEGL